MRLEEEALRPVALDPDTAKRLWDISAELTGLAEDTPPAARSEAPPGRGAEDSAGRGARSS